MLGQLVDSDYLLDFDIFHVSHVTELLHYIDAKYLSSELGGTNNIQVDTWLNIQQNVDIFTVNATRTARKLSAFMRLLHQEDKKAEFQEVREKRRVFILRFNDWFCRWLRGTVTTTSSCGWSWRT